MRYCIFLWLSVTTTFLHADWAINSLWNRYQNGELYPYLTKTIVWRYGIPWEKTGLILTRNHYDDVIKAHPMSAHLTTELFSHALSNTPYQPRVKKKEATLEEEHNDFIRHCIKNIKVIFRNGFYADRKPKPYIFALARLITGVESVPYFDFDMISSYQDTEPSPALLTALKSVNLSILHKVLYAQNKKSIEQKVVQFWQKKYTQIVQNKHPITITVRDKTAQTAKQIGNTCAFHALKNACYLFEGNDAGLLDDGDNQTSFCLEKWQEIAGKNCDLDATDIKKIIYDTRIISPEHITIISNVTEFDPGSFSESDQEFEAFCASLQALCNKLPCKHAYVVGNMTHKENSGGGSIRLPSLSEIFGHWIAILVSSNALGQVTLECADSLATHEAVNEDVLKNFKRIILGSSDEMRMRRDLTNYIDSVLKSSRDSKLRDLKTVMEVAYYKNYLTNSYFITVYIPQILEVLNGIAENNDSIIPTPYPLTHDDILDIIIICTRLAYIQGDHLNLDKYIALNSLLSENIDSNDRFNLLNRYIKRS